jgi:hypothetical protein
MKEGVVYCSNYGVLLWRWVRHNSKSITLVFLAANLIITEPTDNRPCQRELLQTEE